MLADRVSNRAIVFYRTLTILVLFRILSSRNASKTLCYPCRRHAILPNTRDIVHTPNYINAGPFDRQRPLPLKDLSSSSGLRSGFFLLLCLLFLRLLLCRNLLFVLPLQFLLILLGTFNGLEEAV